MTLGQTIRALRKTRRLTQRELAGDDLSGSFISMLEHDQVRPSLATLRILADRLRTPLSALLEPARGRPRVDAMLRQAEGLLRQHQFTAALEHFERTLAEAALLDDTRLQAEAHLGLGQALVGPRQFDLSETHLRHAAELAAALDDPTLSARVASGWGILAMRRRDFPGARGHLIRALGILHSTRDAVLHSGTRAPDNELTHSLDSDLTRSRDSDLQGRILNNLGRVYSELGLPLQAMACFEDARTMLEDGATPATLALLHFNMGVGYLEQQAYEEAAGHLSRASDLFQVEENLQLLGTTKRSLGILMVDSGSPAKGEGLLRQSLAITERMADDSGRAQTLTELARAALAQGRPQEAAAHAEEALRLATRVDDPAEAARAQMALGRIARAARESEDALRHLSAAAATFERLGLRNELGVALRELGFAHLDGGREGEAARAFAGAFAAQGAVAAAER